MEDWIANGVFLGWLIDPYKRNVLVYRADAEPTALTRTFVLGTALWRFHLDLAEVWRCYE